VTRTCKETWQSNCSYLHIQNRESVAHSFYIPGKTLTTSSSTLAQRSQRSASEHGSHSLVRFVKPSRLQSRPDTATSIPLLPTATRRRSVRVSRTLAFPVRSFGSPPSLTTHGTSASRRVSPAHWSLSVSTTLTCTSW
jgi:hypothetical protein